jgi:hypothetical protein
MAASCAGELNSRCTAPLALFKQIALSGAQGAANRMPKAALSRRRVAITGGRLPSDAYVTEYGSMTPVVLTSVRHGQSRPSSAD